MEHNVDAGDIWRAAFTKDDSIEDWVKLGVNRARATGAQTIFWLNGARPQRPNAPATQHAVLSRVLPHVHRKYAPEVRARVLSRRKAFCG